MISLSCYGWDDDAVLYAAVWVKEAGPEWVHCYGLNASDYQAFYDEWHAKGFNPIIISSAFSPPQRFAAVFEKGVPSTVAKHNIDVGEFESRNDWAQKHNYILKWFAADADYSGHAAAIWVPNTTGVQWYFPGFQATADFQKRYDVATAVGDGLAFVTVLATLWYGSIWYRNSPQLNATYQTHHDLTPEGYQGLVDSLKGAGWYPCVVTGATMVGDFGLDRKTRFAAMFRKVTHG